MAYIGNIYKMGLLTFYCYPQAHLQLWGNSGLLHLYIHMLQDLSASEFNIIQADIFWQIIFSEILSFVFTSSCLNPSVESSPDVTHLLQILHCWAVKCKIKLNDSHLLVSCDSMQVISLFNPSPFSLKWGHWPLGSLRPLLKESKWVILNHFCLFPSKNIPL